MTWPWKRRAWRPSYPIEPGLQLQAHRAMLLHHGMMIMVGLIGLLIDPSPSVSRVLGGGLGGEIATGLWSTIFLLFGALAMFARLRRAVAAELWAVGVIIFTRVLWSVLIAVALFVDRPPAAGGPVQYGSLQTAGAIIAGAFALLAWEFWALSYLRTGTVGPRSETDRLTELSRLLDDRLDANSNGGSSTTEES